MKILVAEDSPTQAERLRHILENERYEVAVANNGRVALDLAREFRPNLVISDVVMPEMDGYELASRIKGDPAHADVPVILVTTMSDPADVIRGLQAGADMFVLKPYAPEYLLSRVRHALVNGGAPRRESPAAGVEIHFNGETHLINADRVQILNLLLSTYDAAIERTKELQRSRELLESANARLNDANKDLEAFAYSASHDLRAPLRHVSGYGAMLLHEMEGKLSPSALRYVNEMTAASRRMAQLIEDLLQFSRADRAELRRESVDLAALVRTCIDELEIATRGRDIDWRVAALPAATGDAAMLKQVFANLLGNAVKYSGQRERAVIEVGVAQENDWETVLFVRDNGAGFDMQYVDRLFEAFQRLHTAEEFEGTGVGLATVRRVVERHGGRVSAESEPGRGATFFITLPATGAA